MSQSPSITAVSLPRRLFTVRPRRRVSASSSTSSCTSVAMWIISPTAAQMRCAFLMGAPSPAPTDAMPLSMSSVGRSILPR